MAQRVVTILTSDISGQEIESGQGETVNFALDGTSYEIDLTKKEADELRAALKNYIALGRRASPARPAVARRGNGGGGSGRTPEELAHVRAWAKENGHEVSERGRIKREVLEAFDAAN